MKELSLSLKNRIHETCSEGLISWIALNNKELNNNAAWYRNHLALTDNIETETKFIKSVLYCRQNPI